MPNNPNRLSRFWQELKRRKVLPFVIAYIAACIAIISFFLESSQIFTVPEATIRLLYLLAAIGIPIVFILPWFINRNRQELSPEELMLREFNTEPKRKKVLHNLPAHLPGFIGREKEMDSIKELVSENRLVTLTGANQTVHAPDPAYDAENFTYVPEGDYYICPQNLHLTTTGKWHQASAYRFKRYATRACKSCNAKDLCSKARYGKGIHRSEFHEYIQINKEQVELNKALYKRRQAIVEHPYGTIKRQWGFSYIMTKKGTGRASADVGLMMTAYNLRRIFNILGADRLREYLEYCIDLIWSKIAALKRELAYVQVFVGKKEFWESKSMLPANRLTLIHIAV